MDMEELFAVNVAQVINLPFSPYGVDQNYFALFVLLYVVTAAISHPDPIRFSIEALAGLNQRISFIECTGVCKKLAGRYPMSSKSFLYLGGEN